MGLLAYLGGRGEGLPYLGGVCCLPVGWRSTFLGVCLLIYGGGGVPAHDIVGRQTPVDRMTDTSENITFPHTSYAVDNNYG